MPPMNYVFDASQHAPKQGVGGHPVGKYPFTITNTSIDDTKDQQGKMFVVELTSPAGTIVTRYNLFNSSKQAVDIALGQLSALCHAVNIHRVDMNNEGAALRGGRGVMDVGFQKGHEPTAEKPEGGYVEVKRGYDSNGQEPKAPSQQRQQPQGQPQGQTQQVQPQNQPVNNAPPPGNNQQQNWGNPPNPAPPPQNQPQQQWQPPQNHQQPMQKNPPQGNQQQQWNQAPNNNNPPWG